MTAVERLKLTTRSQTEPSLIVARGHGRLAGAVGAGKHNPYEPETDEWYVWEDGYRDGYQENS